jgi:hypothetical protein
MINCLKAIQEEVTCNFIKLIIQHADYVSKALAIEKSFLLILPEPVAGDRSRCEFSAPILLIICIKLYFREEGVFD